MTQRLEDTEIYDYTKSPHSAENNYPPEFIVALRDISDECGVLVAQLLEEYSESTMQELNKKETNIDQVLEFFYEEDRTNNGTTPIGINIGGVQISIRYTSGKEHMQKFVCTIGDLSETISGSMRKTLLYILAHSEQGVIIPSANPHYANITKIRSGNLQISPYFKIDSDGFVYFTTEPNMREIQEKFRAGRDTIYIIYGPQKGYYSCINTQTGLRTEAIEITDPIESIILTYFNPEYSIPLNTMTQNQLAKLGLFADRDSSGAVRLKVIV